MILFELYEVRSLFQKKMGLRFLFSRNQVALKLLMIINTVHRDHLKT